MTLRYWAVVLLTAAGAGVAGGLLTLLLHGVQHLAFGYTENTFLYGVQHASYERRFLILTLAGLIAGVGWWAQRRWIGESQSVSAAVWGKDGRMRLVPSLVDAVLQIVIVAMGASLGREGAPRQAGAAWASQLSEWAGLSADQRRLLMACGAGAGLAAVYNVPLGGAVFTLEVLLATVRLDAVLPALATSVIATVVAHTIIGNSPTYTIGAWRDTSTLTVFAVVIGPVCGLAAVLFVRLIGVARQHKPTGWHLIVSTTSVFAVLGLVAIAYPQLLGNGKGPTQVALDGTGSLLLFASLMVLKPLATAACLRSGAVGGLFTPALATGALLGAAAGKIWLHVWPGSPLGAFALVGAAGIMAAALRAPVSSVVLIYELTRSGPQLLVPIMLAVIGSAIVMRQLEPKSIYTVGSSLTPP